MKITKDSIYSTKIRDIVRKSEKELFNKKSFNRKLIQELKMHLCNFGLCLNMNLDQTDTPNNAVHSE
jgi:DNA-directed RNA polymerase alpha subunit